jgi:hypothetical protein
LVASVEIISVCRYPAVSYEAKSTTAFLEAYGAVEVEFHQYRDFHKIKLRLH